MRTNPRRVAARYLLSQLRQALDTSMMSPEELVRMGNFLAGQVGSMDAESIAFGAYVCESVPADSQNAVRKLFGNLTLAYRALLIEWFEFALLKRANLGGGGPGIRVLQKGMEAFVEAIPEAVATGKLLQLTQFVPENEYLMANAMNPVAAKILRVVHQAALEAGVLSGGRKARQPGLSVEQDVREWFFGEWLPKNIDRFTRVFTDYARNKQSSYSVTFTLKGGKVAVKFGRRITTAWEAVEELRHRYLHKHGREPWLEVLDRFVDLAAERSPRKLLSIIDRINNLQHSNGLFMDHFPSSVKSWYGGFLNAKYHSPHADELAKFIPDADLRDFLIEVAQSGRRRPMDWRFPPPPAYDKMQKTMEGMDQEVNWRAKSYPRYKGTLQIDRFDPDVQRGLDILKKMHDKRQDLFESEPASPEEASHQMGDWVEWNQSYQKHLKNTQKALEEARQRMLSTPGYAAAWEARNFPEEFLAQFPWSVPGVSSSQLAQFRVRYGRGSGPRRRT